MRKTLPIALLCCVAVVAIPRGKPISILALQASNVAPANEFTWDTSHYAVITDNAEIAFIFPTGKAFNLSEGELQTVKKLYAKQMAVHNLQMQAYYNKELKANPTQKISSKYYIINLREYKMQLVPAITIRTGKEVWINCFCHTYNKDWKRHVQTVEDGGNCYFQMKINITTGTVYDFMVNGEA